MNRRTYGLAWLVVAVVLTQVAGAAAPARVQDAVPPDALAYIGVSDVTKLREAWAKTSLARFWQDPAIQRFTAPGRKKLDEWWQQMAKENELFREKWQTYFPGEIALFVDRPIMHGTEPEFPVFVAAKMGLEPSRYQAQLDKLIATLPPDAKKSEYTVGAVKVRMIRYQQASDEKPEPGTPRVTAVKPSSYIQYAFAGDILVVSDAPEESMKKVLGRLQNPAGPGILERPAIQRARNMLGKQSQIVVYGALDQLIEMLGKYMAELQKAGPMQAFSFSALGLQGIGGLALAVDMDEKRIAFAMALDVPQQGTGVVALLRQVRPSPLASLAITPDSALQYTSFAASWVGIYDTIRSTLQKAVPAADVAVGMALAQIETQNQIRIRDIIAAFGDELAYMTYPPQGVPKGASSADVIEASAAFVIAVKNAQTLRTGLDKLIQFAQGQQAKVETTDFLGFSIRTIAMGEPDPATPQRRNSMSVVITDNFVILSQSIDTVKQMLQLKAGKAANSLANSADYKKARALLPAKIDSFEMSRMNLISQMLLPVINNLLEAPGIGEGAQELVDKAAIPPPEVLQRYFGLAVGGMVLEPAGFSTISIMAAPEK